MLEKPAVATFASTIEQYLRTKNLTASEVGGQQILEWVGLVLGEMLSEADNIDPSQDRPTLNQDVNREPS